MTYTPNQLRELAVSPFQLSYEAGQDICNAFADLIERYELLKKHAEAMANAINDDYADAGLDSVNAFDAYRADFPKEE